MKLIFSLASGCDKQIIDLKGSKIVRVNDITLSWIVHEQIQRMILVAVDIGVRGLFRRLGMEFLFRVIRIIFWVGNISNHLKVGILIYNSIMKSNR